jgi:transcriptional regulator with XRE-family HTH domain
MQHRKKRVSSGLPDLDRLMGSLFIGDNVIWYDEAGSLAHLFCYHLIRDALEHRKPAIFVSFDHSPKSILERLGPLAENQQLTILDCFTNGKGDGSEVFSSFYEKRGAQWPYQVIQVLEPADPEQVSQAVYGLHQSMSGEVRFVFESLTGMQDLWNGEEAVKKFYTRSCPRLYELDTIAYWVMEKGAHSDPFKASVNQIAQVAVELSMARDKSTLTLLKAEKRDIDTLNKPFSFWSDDVQLSFETKRPKLGELDLGRRIKELRSRQGLSQRELARLVGLTPSTISQIESNSTYPSLPALLRIADILAVDVSTFFTGLRHEARCPVCKRDSSRQIALDRLPKEAVTGHQLAPLDWEGKAKPFRIDIEPGKGLADHFFVHKGEEMGYVLAGRLQVSIDQKVYELEPGDVVYLTKERPAQWKNPGPETASLLWLQIA